METNLKSQLEVRIAGDPDDEDVIFTNVTPVQLEQTMAACGTPVSDDAIRSWRKQRGIRLRAIQKTKAGGSSPDRDAQFENIARLIDEYRSAGNPCFSVDTKAKEFLGTLFRKGRSWCSQAPQAFDHDFPSWADGVLIPHGIYDPVRNRGHINLGLSRSATVVGFDRTADSHGPSPSRMAMMRASCSPLRAFGLDFFWSLCSNACSKPSKTNRLRTFSTVCGRHRKASAICRSVHAGPSASSASAFNRILARLTF